MIFTIKWQHLLLIAIIITGALGCSNQAASNAATAVEAYLKALVAKDENALVNASCSSWEADARQELRTFDAVQISLQDMKCTQASQDGDSALVTCSGKIVANYGNEVLDINLADRSYKVVLEANEWRMCGYQ